MKHAYVSLVLHVGQPPSPEVLLALDAALAAATRAHEIVLVASHLVRDPNISEELGLTGPVTMVRVHAKATPDAAIVAGLARAAGDFVVEWHGVLDALDAEQLTLMLGPTDTGSDLVEIVDRDHSLTSRGFYGLTNKLRPPDSPVRKAVGRVYSRHALGQLLGAASFEPQVKVLVADLPVHRTELALDVRSAHVPSFRQRIGDGLSLLAKGTRFGSTVPLSFAVVFALFGLGAAAYAVVVLLVRGRTPEGWTTLMVVAGIGQAAILTMLGLTWGRIEAIRRGLGRHDDATASVTTFAPTRSNGANDLGR